MFEVNKEISVKMEDVTKNDAEYEKINQLYDECLDYLKTVKDHEDPLMNEEDPGYATIQEVNKETDNQIYSVPNKVKTSVELKIENELISNESLNSSYKSERLRRLSQQLPKIIITQSNTSLNVKNDKPIDVKKAINQNHVAYPQKRTVKGINVKR